MVFLAPKNVYFKIENSSSLSDKAEPITEATLWLSTEGLRWCCGWWLSTQPCPAHRVALGHFTSPTCKAGAQNGHKPPVAKDYRVVSMKRGPENVQVGHAGFSI